MHEIYLFKVPKTLDLITQTAPITIMTRSPLSSLKEKIWDEDRCNSLDNPFFDVLNP
jgi:hypothetical protein